MNQLPFYLLQVIAASGLLYGYYHFALRNKRFHRYNRFYLLMAVVISSLIPFLNIPVYFSENETGSSVMLQTLQVISSPAAEETISSVLQSEPTTSTWVTAEKVLYLFYLLAIILFFIRFFISLNKIRSIIKRNPTVQIDKIKFINTDEPGTPFSFFRWLFWNRKIELHSEKGEQIFRHELFHIQQKHSCDIIFMELISTIFWVNPFFHLIKKELKAIHEFLADEFAIKENKNWQYAELLLMQVLNTNIHLVNPFFHNQIKRRIAMITTSKKPSYQYLRKLMVFPVAAIIVFLFAFNYKNKQTDPHEFEKAINSITVVIDAGHGGTDAGAKTWDGKYNEAELSLSIAKKIEALGPEYNINVIMTRKDEKFPGYVTNKNDAFKQRVQIINNSKPHAFVAIHMNTTPEVKQDSKSGFDAYITNQRDNYTDLQLASAVLGELKKIYTTREEIKQRGNASIYVIDEAKAPSLLLECGFINNPKDISFVTNEKNQEKIARAILKGLVTFANTQQIDDLEFQFLQNENERDTSKTQEYENYLVVINGIVQSKRGFKAVDSSVLFSKNGVKITVYKDSTGIKKYGQKGKDGIIEINTKENYGKIADTVPKVDTIYWIKNPEPPAKSSPTQAQLTSWQDSKMYGVWLDGKRINNSELSKYHPSDFGLYYVSKLSKNAVNYGKHYVQIDLYTHKYYEKVYINSTSRKPFLVREIVLSENATRQPLPLLVINGDPMPGLTMETVKKSLPENSIVTQTILNEQDGAKKYGEKGKYGAIELTAKNWDDNIRNMTIFKSDPTVKATDKDLEGAIKSMDTYHDDMMQDDNIVFEKVEIEASFRGGYQEWKNYLEKNLDKNIPVKNGCKPGTYTVIVQFIVGKDGSVSNAKALTNHGFGMEEEAMRMIKKGPDWVPAIQNRHNVKAYRKQPITFVVPDKISDMNNTGHPVYAYLISTEENPTINLADLKKVKQLKLQKTGLVQSYELISFRITIDKPDPGKFYKDFVIKGDNFTDELLKAINDLDSQAYIYIDNIDVKIGGRQKRLPPRVYKAVIITTTPG